MLKIITLFVALFVLSPLTIVAVGRVVAVSWTKRHGRFRNQRPADGVWTKQERRLEN